MPHQFISGDWLLNAGQNRVYGKNEIIINLTPDEDT